MMEKIWKRSAYLNNDALPKWTAFCEKFLDPIHVRKSRPQRVSSPRADSQVLATHSLSTHALLAIVTRMTMDWGYGGFQQEQHRKAARALLDILLHIAFQGQGELNPITL